jgi:Cu-processing system permease protein
MNGILTIARLTIREARQRKILLLSILLGAVFLALFAWGFHSISTATRANGVQAAQVRFQWNVITLVGLYAVNFLVTATAVLLPIDTLSGEIASGVMHTLLTKPMRRFEVVVGKWLGNACILTLYLAGMAGGVLAIARFEAAYTPPNVIAGLGLLWLESIVLLTLSIAGGTQLTTLANGILVFGLYGIAFIGGWMEQIGTTFGSSTARNLGIAASLLVPSEAMWQYAATLMQPAFLRETRLSPFAYASSPSPFMIWWAVGHIAVVFLFAVVRFEKRDM